MKIETLKYDKVPNIKFSIFFKINFIWVQLAALKNVIFPPEVFSSQIQTPIETLDFSIYLNMKKTYSSLFKIP